MGMGKHIPVLGDRLRRFYEYLMADAKGFIDELQRRPEWQTSHPNPENQNPTSALPRSESSFAK